MEQTALLVIGAGPYGIATAKAPPVGYGDRYILRSAEHG